ncbi:unnamed protein product [Rangifer tarandus platyrhynchus]|uniref:Uncharacterized protein n=1 Tax=Rangifer tarandus platyrhynchus TaxID=3082113 RepID=A0ABN8YPU7_RANTA|nr:unnamed protein product [Rangifer tarandus platyrhynchus]
METGFGEATEQEGGLHRPSPAFPASGADSSLLAASVVGWRGARPARGNPGSPPSPPGSRCLSRGARCSAALLAFPGGACTNLELFRGSEYPTPPSPRRPRPAPGRPRSRCSRASARALSPSRRVSLGERSAAPGWAAGGETREPRQGPGHRAPAQPAAGEAAAGAYRAKRRGGCSLFAGRQSCFAVSRPEARGEGTLSAPPESGRGVSPEPRVGISRAAAPSFVWGWCPGYRSRKTSTVLGLEGARRGGNVPSHNLFC